MTPLCIISGETLRQIDWLGAAMLFVGLLMMAAFIARMTIDYFARSRRAYLARQRPRRARAR